MMLSSWANRLRWQSPKSSPHTLTVLSAEPVARRVPSSDISMDMTGSLWPYKDRKNLRESSWKTFTVLSRIATARESSIDIKQGSSNRMLQQYVNWVPLVSQEINRPYWPPPFSRSFRRWHVSPTETIAPWTKDLFTLLQFDPLFIYKFQYKTWYIIPKELQTSKQHQMTDDSYFDLPTGTAWP